MTERPALVNGRRSPTSSCAQSHSAARAQALSRPETGSLLSKPATEPTATRVQGSLIRLNRAFGLRRPERLAAGHTLVLVS